MSWLLPGLGSERLIVQSFDAPRGDDLEVLPTMFADGYMGAWLEEVQARATLIDIFVTTRGVLAGHFAEDANIIETLSAAFHRGELVLLGERRQNATPPAILARPPAEKFAPPPVAAALTWFQVRLVDDVGAPIGEVPLRFSVNSETRTVSTDSSGTARIDRLDAGFASVAIADIPALRRALAPRWTRPRAAKLPSVDSLSVRMLKSVVESVSLENEVIATIAITPFFECNEVPGADFEFGRSFVRSSAIQRLSEIVEDLHGEPTRKAMVFGHSDKAGPEALNKELSERRAKAVVALFTHDADSWEELFLNKSSGGSWSELWGTKEVQHMLNALHIRDDEGAPIVEDGQVGPKTSAAIERFQRGDYPDRPAEQAPLVVDGLVGPLTRKELFFAYAKRISRAPLPPDRLATVNGEKYMGCGEYNPLSLGAKDAESRRVVVFLFDIAAEPQALPCKLRSLAPCRANTKPEAAEVDPDGKAPYRCQVYQEIAKLCPCNGGAHLNHDLIVQLPYTLAEANTMPHILVLESEDMTVVQRKTLAADARAHDEGFVEVYFTDLPPMLAYRLRCEGIKAPYIIFEFTPYPRISKLALQQNTFDPEPFYLYSYEPYLQNSEAEMVI